MTANRKKDRTATLKIAAVAVAVIAVGATIGVLFIGTPSYSEQTYNGLLVSGRVLGDPANASAVVGYRPGSSALEVVPVDVALNFTGVVGGQIKVRSDGEGSHVVSITSTADEEMNLAQLEAASRFTNVLIDAPSLSIVHDGYTYAVASNQTTDYCWVAPGLSVTGLYEPVEIRGTLITGGDLAAIATAFPNSTMARIKTSDWLDLVDTYSLEFMGDPSKLILVDQAEYIGAINVEGDSIATLIHGEGYNWSPQGAFFFDGINWINHLPDHGVTVNVVVDHYLSDRMETIWMVVRADGSQSPPKGICHMAVAVTDEDVVGMRCMGSTLHPFTPEFEYGNYTFHAGVAVSFEAPADAPVRGNITDLWQDVKAHDNGMHGAVTTTCFVVPCDSYWMGGLIDLQLGSNWTGSWRLANLAMNYHQTCFMMIDDAFIGCFEGGGSGISEHVAFVVAPFTITASGLSRAAIEGVLYDAGVIIPSDLSFPIIIADSMTLGCSDRVNTSIPEIGSLLLNDSNGAGVVGVSFDAMTFGASLGIVLSTHTVPDSGMFDAYWPYAEAIIGGGEWLPVSLYEGVCQDQDGMVYHVPIVCINDSQGYWPQPPEEVRVEGIYIDSPFNSSAFEAFCLYHADLAPPTDTSNTSADVLGMIDAFEAQLVKGHGPRGFVLAYSMSLIDWQPPDFHIESPAYQESIHAGDLNFTVNVTNRYDFPRWFGVAVDFWNGTGYEVVAPYTAFPSLGLGVWSSGDLPHWQDFVDKAVASGYAGQVRLIIEAGDFTAGHSWQVIWINLV